MSGPSNLRADLHAAVRAHERTEKERSGATLAEFLYGYITQERRNRDATNGEFRRKRHALRVRIRDTVLAIPDAEIDRELGGGTDQSETEESKS